MTAQVVMTVAKPVVQPDLRIMLYIPKEIKPDFGMVGTQVFQFGFVTLDKQDHVRNVSTSWVTEPHAAFSDLSFRAQADGQAKKPYGEDLEYRSVFCVDLARAEMHVAMLKRIEKVQKNFPVRPETFGQYVQMVCHGLGVHGVVCEGNYRSGSGNLHDDHEHQVWKVSEIQWLVDRRIAEFAEKHAEAWERAKV